MPDTIREQVVEAFALKVGAQRCQKLDSDSDLPAKSIWDSAEEATKTEYGATRVSILLGVEYLAKVDSLTYANHSKQANAMLGEIIQAATAGDNSLGGLCRSIQYQQVEFNYPDDGAQEVEIFVVFEVVYQFATGDPFTVA